jgi:hypothetical protein
VSVLTFNEELHEYRINGVVVPSVTSITGMLDSFAGIPPEVLERKTAIGKATHKAAEIINQGLTLDQESIDPAIAGYVNAYLKFLAEVPCEVLMTERQVGSERHGYAGTIDLLLRMKNRKAGFWEAGELWLPDLKTVAQLRPSTRLQTAGYRLALPDVGVPRSAIGRGVIQLKPNCQYHLEAHHDASDEGAFLSLLNVYKWRIANE